MDYNDINNSGKLEDYGGLGYMMDYRKSVDDKNANEVMKAQFDLIQRQKQEIEDQRRYREDSRKDTKQSFRYAIIGVAIASLTLVATIIGWFI